MPPVNDTLANAITLSTGSYTEDTTTATSDAQETGYFGGEALHTVWYKWENTFGYDASVRLYNVVGDAGYGVDGPELDAWTFTGTPTDFDDLNSGGIYGNYVGDSSHPGQDDITLPVNTGKTIYVIVDNWDYLAINYGIFSFSVDIIDPGPPPPPPVNDDFANATLLSGSSGSVNGTNVDATRESPDEETDHSPQTVWYKWTAPFSGNVIFTTSEFNAPNDISDSYLKFYSGASLATLVLLREDDDNGINFYSMVSVNVTSGTEYHIRVNGYSIGETGEFTLTWDLGLPPANDDLANAEVLTLSGTVSGTTVHATTEAGPDTSWYGPDVPTVWYKYTNTGSSAVFTVNNLIGDAGFDNGEAIDMWTITGTPSNLDDLSNVWQVRPGQTKLVALANGESVYLDVYNRWYDPAFFGTFTFGVTIVIQVPVISMFWKQ